CATVREMVGMAGAGLGDDLLLANEGLDLTRLAALAARVTVAAHSEETIAPAAPAGGALRRGLTDVHAGLRRCGCQPSQAGRLADVARRAGLTVRGVMGYEGHVVGLPDRSRREELCEQAMERLRAAHRDVGGDVVSAGGTGTFDINRWATEIQAGSHVLMGTAYDALATPFLPAA